MKTLCHTWNPITLAKVCESEYPLREFVYFGWNVENLHLVTFREGRRGGKAKDHYNSGLRFEEYEIIYKSGK